MAGGANSLTKDARPAGTTATGAARAPGAPTIPATAVHVLAEALRGLGYDVPSLLASMDMATLDLANPDARLPCEAYGVLLSRAMQERPTPNIGLKLAQATPVGAYPLLDYLILTSETVAAGLRQLSHYVRLTESPVSVTLRESATSVTAELTCVPAKPISVEFFASLMVLDFRQETSGRFRAASVAFRHTPDDVSEFERVLDCPVRTNAAQNIVTANAEMLDLPLDRRDSVLRRVLEAQAN